MGAATKISDWERILADAVCCEECNADIHNQTNLANQTTVAKPSR